MNLENFPTNEIAIKMIKHISTEFYDNSYVGKWLFEVMGIEMADAREKIEELAYQIFPETATWGLMYHEIKYGLPIADNLSDEERRKRIIIKRDTKAPMNPWRMEQIVKVLTGYEVKINEDLDAPNTFRVILSFGAETIDFFKVRENLNYLKQSHVAIDTVEEHTEHIINQSCGVAHQVSKTIYQMIM